MSRLSEPVPGNKLVKQGVAALEKQVDDLILGTAPTNVSPYSNESASLASIPVASKSSSSNCNGSVYFDSVG